VSVHVHEKTAHPMPPQALPVLYWSESVDGWWPRINRLHRVCGGGGWLRAYPPGAVHHAIGWITCDNCAQDVAEIRPHRIVKRTPEQWAALTDERAKRGPKPKQPVLPALPEQPRTHPCADCATALVRRRGSRCHDCLQVYRSEAGAIARLVVALGDGQTRQYHELAQALGISETAVRHAVSRGIRQGRPLVKPRRGSVRLGVRP
jgi:hypothetical protein